MESIATASVSQERASSSRSINEGAYKALLGIELTMPHIDVFVGLIYEALEFEASNSRDALAAQAKLYSLMRALEHDVREITSLVEVQLRSAICGVH